MSATSILVQPLQRASRPQLYKPRPRVVLSHAPQAPPTVPLITRESLATRFRQNWAAKHPSDSVSVSTTQVDDSLTSLNWLQNLNIMNMATPTPPDSPEPELKHAGVTGNLGDMQVDPNAVLNMVSVPVLRRDADSPGEVQLSTLSYKLTPGLEAAPPSVDKVDYKSNPYVKPPYSYATLICMAMRESNKNKITLSGIYTWITDNFMYYRVADPSWQNSIRHNLSLNKCFQKVPRQKDEPGKGGFWRINPEYSDMFVNGIFKKRRSTGRETITSPPLKKVKHESEADLAAASLADVGLGMPEVRAHMPEHNALLHLEQADDTTETLRGDFNWNAILYQDIEVGGVRIKTEDIIDEHDLPSPVDGSINMPLSPPASDSNSDIALEDLLNSADMTAGAPPFDDPLDLTIQGASIKPPDWWSESMNKDLMQRMLMSPEHEPSAELHTPLGPSPTHEIEHEEFSHPWAESRAELDEAIASFDLDLQNLFDEDLTGGSMLDS